MKYWVNGSSQNFLFGIYAIVATGIGKTRRMSLIKPNEYATLLPAAFSFALFSKAILTCLILEAILSVYVSNSRYLLITGLIPAEVVGSNPTPSISFIPVKYSINLRALNLSGDISFLVVKTVWMPIDGYGMTRMSYMILLQMKYRKLSTMKMICSFSI
jgi:hypothetical protein